MKYLIKPIAEKQDLEDTRDVFMTHPEICLPHTQLGCYYSAVIDGKDGLEAMLAVSTEAEVHVSVDDAYLLVTDFTANFTWELEDL